MTSAVDRLRFSRTMRSLPRYTAEEDVAYALGPTAWFTQSQATRRPARSPARGPPAVQPPSATPAPRRSRSGARSVSPKRPVSPGRSSKTPSYAPVLNGKLLVEAIAADDDVSLRAAFASHSVVSPLRYRQRGTGYNILHMAVLSNAGP